MTISEPAGVGTAESIAERIVREHEAMWAAFGGYEVTRRDAWPPPLDELASAIASAITASRRQAKEEDAKIAEMAAGLGGGEHASAAETTHYVGLMIAERIRSSINPPGEKA